MNLRSKHLQPLLGALLLLLLTPVSASAQSPGADQPQREFLTMMSEYVGFSRSWVDLTSDRAGATLLAIEAITDIYQRRGRVDQAVEHLERLLEAADDRASRNLLRLKLKDLYVEMKRFEDALAVLDALVKDNDAAGG